MYCYRKPRTDWRKERETNQETFGHSAVRSLTYRRPRGFMGGRGGRGGHMSSGYRYNSGKTLVFTEHRHSSLLHAIFQIVNA